MTIRALYATAELYPFVKTGGLGDVAAGLPPALKGLGVDVRYLLPGYSEVLDALSDAVVIHHFDGRFGLHEAALLRGLLPNGLVAYVLDAPAYYERANPYVTESGQDWPDNHLRFGAFCHVAAHMDTYDRWWKPDIIHGHDWHCGLMPAYLAQRQDDAPTSIFTIHNIAYQGLFPADYAQALHIPPHMVSADGCEYYGQIGFLKSGIQYAQAITTVSPAYAREILEPPFGCGLEGALHRRAIHLRGIINGIDPVIWSPEHDAEIASPYTPKRLSGKAPNKRALLKEFGLKGPQKNMLCGVVSRLTPQKGIDELIDALPDFLDLGVNIVILGAGDAALEKALAELAERYPEQIGLHIGYDEALAHRIIAGADVMLMPSVFEPCGLVQLYALRYGTLPVVQATGGLADTVKDSVTGFSYQGGSAELSAALSRALLAWEDKKLWKKYQLTAMAEDWSWNHAARDYLSLYEQVIRDATAAEAPAPNRSENI